MRDTSRGRRTAVAVASRCRGPAPTAAGWPATWTTRSTVTHGQSVKYTVIDRSPSRSSSMVSSARPALGVAGHGPRAACCRAAPRRTRPRRRSVSQSAVVPTDRAGYVVSASGGCQPSVAVARSQSSGTVTVSVLRESESVGAAVEAEPRRRTRRPRRPTSRTTAATATRTRRRRRARRRGRVGQRRLRGQRRGPGAGLGELRVDRQHPRRADRAGTAAAPPARAPR